MAKAKESITVEITPRDIAKALDGISEWVRSVRSVVLLMDPDAAVHIKRTKSPSAQGMLDGCPPPDPCEEYEEDPKPRRRPVPKRAAQRPRPRGPK